MAADNYCFSPDYVVTYRNNDTPALGFRYYFSTKNTVFGNVPDGSPFSILTYTVYDVYQYGNSVRHVFYQNNDPQSYDDRPNKKLLKVEADPSGFIVVWIFDPVNKTTSRVDYPTNVPCHPGFSLAEDVVLASGCDGYTYYQYFHDGEGGVTIVNTPNSNLCGYVDPVEDVDITVVQNVRIEHCEPVNPLMLAWKNSIGGWDYWLFSKKQVYTTDTESKGFVGVPVWDIETAEELQKEIGKTKSQSVLLGADNLSMQEKIGIEEILSSNIVYQLFKDGTKRRVAVKKGTFLSIDNSAPLQSIEFEIALPDSYTLSN